MRHVRSTYHCRRQVLRLLRGLSSLPGYADLLLSLNALDKVVGMLLKPDSLPAPGLAGLERRMRVLELT